MLLTRRMTSRPLPRADATSAPLTAGFFAYSVRVSYAHCTLGDHVYYARYLDLLEIARGEFFRQIGFSCRALQEQGIVFQVMECSLRYLKPARYDDLLEIRLAIADLRKVRFRFVYEIHRGADKLLEATSVMFCAGLDERPARIPEHLLAAFAPYSLESV